MRRTIPIVVLSVLSGLAQAQTASPFNCSNFLTFNGDQSGTLNTFQQSPETMAWNWFVCLNQADASNGGLRVWETFKPSDQVYLLKGAEPLPYSERENLPSEVPELAQKQGMDPKGLFQFLGNDTAAEAEGVDALALVAVQQEVAANGRTGGRSGRIFLYRPGSPLVNAAYVI